MSEINREIPNDIAARVIVMLLLATLVFAIVSITVIVLIVHNIYAASYYTLSVLFDANGEGASTFIASVLATKGFGYLFYSFLAISLLDGLAKAVIIGFVIAAFINLLTGIDLKSKLEVYTAKHMKGHVIIGGYSMLAERLCNDLKRTKQNTVIIEKDPEKVNLLRDSNFNVVEGDFTDKKTLDNASLGKAKAIVFATESDFINLMGIVTAHHMEPERKDNIKGKT